MTKAAVALQIFSVIFAAAAALLWLISAMIKMPGEFNIGVKPSIATREGYPAEGSFASGYSKELIELGKALRCQSTWSARAAISACISATLQIIAFFL